MVGPDHLKVPKMHRTVAAVMIPVVNSKYCQVSSRISLDLSVMNFGEALGGCHDATLLDFAQLHMVRTFTDRGDEREKGEIIHKF